MAACGIKGLGRRRMAETTPVGVAVWEQMATAVNDLHSFVQGSRFVNQGAGMETVVCSEWANLIGNAQDWLVPETHDVAGFSIFSIFYFPYKMDLACIIKARLKKANTKLTAWPERPSKYGDKARVLSGIATSLSHVEAFIEYCNSMTDYTTIFGRIKITTCPLVTHLVTCGFKKAVARQICQGLGAALPLHLTYVDLTDIQHLQLVSTNELKLEAEVMRYCASLDDTPRQLAVPLRARLDCMRACVARM